MPAATPLEQRQQVFDLHHAGLGPLEIAQQLSLSVRTIRDLLARWRTLPAGHDLAPGFDRCGRTLAQPRRAVQESCLQLRRLHDGWGAERIRLDLLDLHPKEHVPPTRTLQFWLRQAGLTPPPAVLVAAVDDRRAREPHEVWQMDAVECLRLADGSGACWLRQIDECSGAILATDVFPTTAGRRCPSPRCKQRSGGASHAGAVRSGCGWTTASLGATPVGCLRS